MLQRRTISFPIQERPTLEAVLQATGHMGNTGLYEHDGAFDLMLRHRGKPEAIDHADAFARQCDSVVLNRKACGTNNFVFTMPTIEQLNLLGGRKIINTIVLRDWESPDILMRMLEQLKKEDMSMYDTAIAAAKRNGHLP